MELTFKQYLAEQITDQQINQLVKDINTNCEPFLRAIKGNWLYRGVSFDVPEQGTIIKTHPDRKPLDTPLDIHNALDMYFFKQFGIKFRSQNTMFCSPLRYTATKYGNAVAVFPIGNFNYCWCPDIRDLYEFINTNLLNSNVAIESFRNKTPTEQVDQIENIFKRKYIQYEYNRGIRNNKEEEVMVQTQSYYAVPLSTLHIIERGLL